MELKTVPYKNGQPEEFILTKAIKNIRIRRVAIIPAVRGDNLVVFSAKTSPKTSKISGIS